MKVVAGKLGGRQFDAAAGKRTHPMSERVRGSLFSTLGELDGLTLLDAFSGSGALSFEAISRGASHVQAVEIDPRAKDTINRNQQHLGISKLQFIVTRANVSLWSDNNSQRQFDIVLVAPPYDNLQLKVLQKLVRHVGSDGLYVLDWPGNLDGPEFQGLTRLKNKKFGDAQLIFYRRSD